jgi:hypothetical protein
MTAAGHRSVWIVTFREIYPAEWSRTGQAAGQMMVGGEAPAVATAMVPGLAATGVVPGLAAMGWHQVSRSWASRRILEQARRGPG